jgi:hypothetical protein
MEEKIVADRLLAARTTQTAFSSWPKIGKAHQCLESVRTVKVSSAFLHTAKVCRGRIKIGDHEFDAEGPADVVQDQFAAFKEMIATLPTQSRQPQEQERDKEQNSTSQLPHLPLEKIIKVEGRVVSLTARCESVDEAVMLILLGQKEFRNNQEVTGAEIMDGLKQSGYLLGRVDLVLDKLSKEGSTIIIGVHRARRYRLTNVGHSKALSIAKEVLTTVL